jgi:hypothetical protein
MPARSKESEQFPPFPPLQWEVHGWTGRVVLPSWKGFQSREGAYGAQSSDKPSAGAARLHVARPAGEATPPTSEQIAAYRYLLDHDTAIREAVLTALLEAYPGMQDEYGFDEDDELMPAVEQPGQFRELVGLSEVHILPVARDGVAYIGFEFGCTWDDEHGLGFMTHKDRVLEVGGADTSFDEWIATQDAAPRAKKKRGSGDT